MTSSSTALALARPGGVALGAELPWTVQKSNSNSTQSRLFVIFLACCVVLGTKLEQAR